MWLYHACVGDVPQESLARYPALLSAAEIRRWRAFHFEKDRRLFLVAHALLRVALSRHASISPAEWRFAEGDRGKPEIDRGAGQPRLPFSLSHSGGLAVCAISTAAGAAAGPIGVDVEDCRRPVSPALCAAALGPEEHRWLEAQPEAARQRCFFALWTVKEAYVKALGVGLALPFTELSVSLDPPGLRRNGTDLTADWEIALLAPTGDHLIALAMPRSGSAGSAAQSITSVALIP